MFTQLQGDDHVTKETNILNQSNMEKIVEINTMSNKVQLMVMLMSLNHFCGRIINRVQLGTFWGRFKSLWQ